MRTTMAWVIAAPLVIAALLASAAACRRGGDAADGLVAVRDGVVVDRRTGLEWTSRDHERSLVWEEADRHCRGLAPTAEGREWRLPEIGELAALYDPRVDAPCGDRRCHLDPLIGLGGPYVWSVTTRGPGTRFYFDFSYGNSFSPGIGPELVRRVLCVRGDVH